MVHQLTLKSYEMGVELIAKASIEKLKKNPETDPVILVETSINFFHLARNV